VNRGNDTWGVGLCAHSDNTALTYDWIKEIRKSVTNLIPPAQGDTKRMVAGESTASALALPGFINDNTTWGTNVTDPGNLWYFHIVVNDLTTVSALTGIVGVKLTQKVVFFDKRQVSRS